MPSCTIEKCVQGSFSQSHVKFGEAARIQCGCNALLVVSWARENLLKYLGFIRDLLKCI